MFKSRGVAWPGFGRHLFHNFGNRSPMKLSVVINTYNRCQSLARTLRSLEFQTNPEFEVIVVNGPSTDATETVLEDYAGRIRVARCPERNLSVSRNMGIDHAAGDIVAFIDDDSLATPGWVGGLLAAYVNENIGGAGGLVYDHTGRKLQYRYSHCNRTGIPNFRLTSPIGEYNRPGSDPFLYLQGTNCSFRREVLEAIGGFDEEFEYYLDETDVCMRILDAGHRLSALDGAIVHHKYLASYLRTPQRLVLDPYSPVKNTCYFSLQNHRRKPIPDLEQAIEGYIHEVKASAHWNYDRGAMSAEQKDYFLGRVDEASAAGKTRGQGERRTRAILPRDDGRFLAFPTIVPAGTRHTFCFISREYPPGDSGGIGRYTYDQATSFARMGHEVHVITNSEREEEYVDIEDDVWVHRLQERIHPAVGGHALYGNISLLARNYRELARIHRENPISLVVAPIWLCEGAMAACDPRFPVVMTLMTTTRILTEINPELQNSAQIRHLILLEQANAKAHAYAHAISQAIAKRVQQDCGLPSHTFVAPLGIADHAQNSGAADIERQSLRVLFVGRIEKRKAVDILLEAAEQLIPEFPHLEFHLVGKRNEDEDSGAEAGFLRRNAHKPEILQRVRFLGAVTEEELRQEYGNADIFCLPSRYESFGLVLLEAMSFSKPLVAARAGGMPEIVEDGQTGFLFTPDDSRELAESLRRLIVDPALRQSMGAQGRRRFEEAYDLPVTAKALLAHYEEIMVGHAQASGQFQQAHEAVLQERFGHVLAHAMGISAEQAGDIAVALLSEPELADAANADTQALSRTSMPWRLARGTFRRLCRWNPRLAGKLRYRLEPAFVAYAHKLQSSPNPFKAIIKATARRLSRLPVLGWPVHILAAIYHLPRIREGVQTLQERAQSVEQRLNQAAGLQERMESAEQRLAQGSDALREIGRTQAEQRATLQTEMTAHGGILQEMQQAVAGLNAALQQNATRSAATEQDMSRLQQAMQDLQSGMNHHSSEISNFMEYVNKRLEFVRREMLFEMKFPAGKAGEPASDEPRILNPGKLEEAGDKGLKLNLGCGHIALEEYVNIDRRELPGVDILAEAYKLPFAPREVAEIFSSHFLEHFPQEQLRRQLLPYWKALLVPGGVFRAVVPDAETMISEYSSSEYPYEFLREVTFGAQDYEGDFHYNMFTPDSLAALLEEAGFVDVRIVERGRRNGACYEFEIVSHAG